MPAWLANRLNLPLISEAEADSAKVDAVADLVVAEPADLVAAKIVAVEPVPNVQGIDCG